MSSGDRSRTATRLAAMALAVTMVTAACTDGGTVVGESMNDAVADAAEQAATTAAESTGDDTTADGTPSDEAEADEQTSVEAEPRFDLEGELPLTTAEVNDMLAFIEAQTDREYLYKPRIVAQTQADYEADLEVYLADQVAAIADEGGQYARFYQALGLSDQSPDELTASLTGVLTSADGINGYYDPETDALYVPTDALDDGLFRSLLVHELVHALDGQHVDLGQILDDIRSNPDDPERNFGMTAVVEGRATAIQFSWMQANGVVPAAGELPESLADVPPAFLNALTLPYNFGAGWVAANGGPAGTWDAFETPPANSELVLFPTTPATEATVEVATPTAEGPELLSTSWGAADLVVWLLSETMEPSQVEVTTVLAAADGWAGGAMTLWGDDTESCVRMTMVADSADDLTEIESAVTTWADKADGRTVATTGDEVTVTGCAPFQS